MFLILLIAATALAGLSALLVLTSILLSPTRKISKQYEELKRTIDDRFHSTERLIQSHLATQHEKVLERLSEHRLSQQQSFAEFKETLIATLQEQRQSFDKRQLESMQSLQVSLQKGLKLSSDLIGERVDKLTQQTGDQLKDISGQVEKRLTEGFEKTTAIFSDVIKRLALIDEAQKRITELSSSVVDLQAILSDKRSRGAFGEIQLSSLLRNALPEKHFSLQHTLSTGVRADCLLYLPEPTGNIAIDAKFPLENFKTMMDLSSDPLTKQQAERQFKQDIKKHIQDIAAKYIIPGETADGAVMFIPSEAIFAEIHGHHADLIEIAQHARVWLVSPTTMLAIITTARAVIKDEATRKQVGLIREHLRFLAKDFSLFQARMEKLAKHIEQANTDVSDINISARKISSRFERIEQVDLKQPEEAPIAITDLESQSV